MSPPQEGSDERPDALFMEYISELYEQRARFQEVAGLVTEDLNRYFEVNRVRFLYLDCTVELFGTIYAA